MGRILLRSSCAFLGVCSFNINSELAFAQVEADAALKENDDTSFIIVTAARRNENLQDVPMSIDVASGEQLQKLAILDIKDVQKLAPGLQLSNSSGRNNTATLRGVTFDPDQGTSPSVDFYINEVPTSAQTAFAAIYDIEQIEVLRGPQGALRGRTAPAGAITVRNRWPELDTVGGYLQATATDRSGYNLQGAVSMPLVKDKLALRAAFLVDGSRGNQVYNVATAKRSRSRTESARLSLRWEPDENFKLNLSYQYLNIDNLLYQQVIGRGAAPTIGSSTRSGPLATTSDYIAVSEGDRRFRNRSHFFTGSAEWNLGSVTLMAIGGYQNSRLTQLYDQDTGNSIPGLINNSLVRQPYKSLSTEFRAISNNSGIWNWSLSAFYSKTTGEVTQSLRSNTYFGNYPAVLGLYMPINTFIRIPMNDRSISIAASSRFEFTPELTLEIGARYTDQKNRQFAYSTVSSPGFPGVSGYPIPARPPIPERTVPLVPEGLAVGHGKALTGGATVTYKITPDITTYIAYGRSFRLGSAGVGVPQNISNDLIRSKSERSDAVELGLKMSLLDRKITFNLSAFYQKYKGYIVRIPYIYYDFGARNALGQAAGPPDGVVDGVFPSGFNYNGDATVKGLEATVHVRATPNSDVMIGASYAHGRFNKAKLPCNDFNGDGVPDTFGAPKVSGSGNVSYCPTSGRLAEIPDFNLTVNGEIRFPMESIEPFVSSLVTYRPKFHYNRTNFDYRSNVNVGIFIGIRDLKNSWEIKGFVKNALNQKRVINVLGDANVPTASVGGSYNSGYSLISSTQPREFGVAASLNF
ncbi:TonB-dependent receptor [Caenibius tardaugens]|uniref:TonB-dependent receptor n=1 Tax=Caenibius tardaugens TaxID=169176 RepID=UPI001B355C3E|nr:TonB-dependent receptor [Caenibius tardaugens]